MDPNESSKFTVVYKGDNVTVGTGNKTIGTNPNTQVVLDQFYKINKETLGEFLRLEYTGFQNSKYGNVDIEKIIDVNDLWHFKNKFNDSIELIIKAMKNWKDEKIIEKGCKFRIFALSLQHR